MKIMFSRYFLVCIASLASGYGVSAQQTNLQWFHSLDTVALKSMMATADGGIVATAIMPGGDIDIACKLDKNGKRLWTFMPFTTRSIRFQSIQMTETGLIALSGLRAVGESRRSGVNFGYSALLDNDGQIVWTKPIDSADVSLWHYAPYVRTSSGEFVHFYIPPTLDDVYRLYFRRIDKEGVKGDDILFDSVATHKGGIIVPKTIETKDHGFLTMYAGKSGSLPDSWHVTKLDAQGKVVFSHELSEKPGNEFNVDILELPDGSFLTANSSRENLNFKGKGFVRKFSADGVLLAKTEFAASELLHLSSLAVLPNGNYIVAGGTTTYEEYQEAINQTIWYSYPAFDGFMAVFNDNLEMQWQMTFGEKGIGEIIEKIIPIDNDEFYIGGFYNNKRGIARLRVSPSVSVDDREQVHVGTKTDVSIRFGGSVIVAENAEALVLCDVLGRTVRISENNGKTQELHVGNLPRGIYYANARNNKGQAATLPILIH